MTKQRGLYQSKTTCSPAAIQRPGHRAEKWSIVYPNKKKGANQTDRHLYLVIKLRVVPSGAKSNLLL